MRIKETTNNDIIDFALHFGYKEWKFDKEEFELSFWASMIDEFMNDEEYLQECLPFNGVATIEELEEYVLNKVKEYKSKSYTVEDLRNYISNLEESQMENIKENEEEIYIVISSEEVVINKQDNSVISSFGNYNSVHEIVEELVNR